MTAEKTPVKPLAPGAQGPAVEALQRLLARFDRDLAVDGRYGAETEEAVRLFQRDTGLLADGVAGAETLAALRIEHAILDLEALILDGPQGKPLPAWRAGVEGLLGDARARLPQLLDMSAETRKAYEETLGDLQAEFEERGGRA